MSSPASHYVRVGGEVRGPLRTEQLREMATIEVVTPESEVAASPDGPWVRLATLPLWEVVKPIPPAFGFKPNEFSQINTDAVPAMDPNEEIRRASQPAASLRGREVVVPTSLRATRGDEPLNEVQRMVLEVNERVAAYAPPEILPPVPSRFRFLRWLVPLSVIGSGVILGLPWYYGRSYDRMSVVILLGWVALYNTMLVAVPLLEARQKDLFQRGRMQLEKTD